MRVSLPTGVMAENEKHGKTAAGAASCFIPTKYSQINYFTKPPDNSVSKSSQSSHTITYKLTQHPQLIRQTDANKAVL